MVFGERQIRKRVVKVVPGSNAEFIEDKPADAKPAVPQKKESVQAPLFKFAKPQMGDAIEMKKLGDDSKVVSAKPKTLVLPTEKKTDQLTFDTFTSPQSGEVVLPSSGNLSAGSAGGFSNKQVNLKIRAANVRIAQLKRQLESGSLHSNPTNMALYNGLLAAKRLAANNRLGPENHAELITAVREKINKGETDGLVINAHLEKKTLRMFDLGKNGIDVVK